jgi:predicted alpha/beta-hydrolase family hydrolase
MPRRRQSAARSAAIGMALVSLVLKACGTPSGSAGPTVSAVEPSPSGLPRVSSRASILPPSIGASCTEEIEGASLIRFPSDNGVSLGGAIIGTGSIGVVLVHGSLATLCEWLPFANVLARQGRQVLAFDLNGFGSSPPSAGSPGDPRYDQDIAGAVRAIRERGARRVVVVGEGFGGSAAIVAAAAISPRVDGVVDVSGPALLSGADAATAAPALTMPVLFISSTKDGDDDGLEQVVAGTGRDLRQTEDVAGNRHGISLLDPELEPEARRLRASIEAFIDEVTG